MSIDLPALVVVAVLLFLLVVKVTTPPSVARRIAGWTPDERAEAALYLRRRDVVLPWSAAAVAATATWSTWTQWSGSWGLWGLACVLSLVLVSATRASAERLEHVLRAHAVPRPGPGDPAEDHRRSVDRWRSALVVAFAATWIVRLVSSQPTLEHPWTSDVARVQVVLLPAVAVCAGRLAWLSLRGARRPRDVSADA